MFYIGFTTPVRTDEEGGRHAFGGLELGEDSDTFAADLGVWTMAEYEAQWRQAIARLAAGKPSSALVTSYAGPGNVIHSMRPIWRVGNTVYFQERLVVDRNIEPPDVRERFYGIVGERSTVSEDGTAISKWAVPFPDVLAFIATE